MEWYRLRLVGLKDNIISKLMSKVDSYDDLFKLDKDQLRLYFSLDNESLNLIYSSRQIDLEKELEKLKTKGIKIVSLKSNDFPEQLKNISHPPVFLYYKGDLSLIKNRTIGIVGTRKATTYGRVCCEKITKELVNSNITTVSGLALGIDAICHKKTLELKGKTIAVVGSGLDKIYPFENKKIWLEIEEKGLLISEFPLGTDPLAYNFPLRNRIIVGLSKGIVVIESKEKGGSLITASLALDEGRDVFAIPGDIFSPSSLGTNKLIKNSEAKLITSGEDILKEFDWEISNTVNNLNLSSNELRIYNILDTEKNLDQIIVESKMKPREILAILMELEIKSIISSVSGGKYRRKI